ncbi:MAG TPA: SIMPL domain-containing protein [Acidobacteriaceae bacterium]
MQKQRAALLGLAISLAGWYHAAAQQVQVSPANRTIAITTTENAERRADLATLHIGYHLYAPDSQQAYAQAATASQAISAALKKLGVSKDAIASESQSTQETQEYRNAALTPEERAQHRFEAMQSWTVKTTPDVVADVLAVAVTAGADASGQVDWSVADEASLTAEAGTRALGHAKEIASGMARGLGAKVGNLMYASNEVEAIRPLMRMRTAPGSAGSVTVSVSSQKLDLSAPMITRSATVSAIFAIE